MQKNLIFLDTETTDKIDGRLVQLAYKKRGDASMVVEFFKPPVPIKIEAMAVHHITEKKIVGKPAFADSRAKGTLSALLADAILVAHNAKFDVGILKTEGVETKEYICTLKVAQTMYDLPMYKMQYLRYLWGIEDDDATAHDAEGDVLILEKVFEHMMRDYAVKNNASESETIDAFIAISKNPLLLRTLSFGKHAGKTFEEIKATDPSYLQWMATLPGKDEDFVYTVNYYLGNLTPPRG
jgi:exodeoxyribonuclease X